MEVIVAITVTIVHLFVGYFVVSVRDSKKDVSLNHVACRQNVASVKKMHRVGSWSVIYRLKVFVDLISTIFRRTTTGFVPAVSHCILSIEGSRVVFLGIADICKVTN